MSVTSICEPRTVAISAGNWYDPVASSTDFVLAEAVREKWSYRLREATRWRAIGKVRRTFDPLLQHIQNQLVVRSDDLNQGLKLIIPHRIDCYIVGPKHSPERGEPCLGISHFSHRYLRRAKREIVEDEVWKKFFECTPVKIRKFHEDPPAQRLGGDHIRDERPFTSGEVLVKSGSPAYGAPIYIACLDSKVYRKARLGGVLWLGDRAFGLTVAHCFKSETRNSQDSMFQPHSSSEPDSDSDHGSDSGFDSDNDDNDDNYNNDSDLNLDFNSSVTGHQVSSVRETTEIVPTTHSSDMQQEVHDKPTNSASYPTMHMQEVADSEDVDLNSELSAYELLGSVVHLSSGDSEDMVDWALIEITNVDVLSRIFADRISTIQIQPVTKQAETSRKVRMIRSEGDVTGYLSAHPSLIGWPGASKMIWATEARFPGFSLAYGDSGCWVIDENNTLLGHIVGGVPGSSTAYISSIRDVQVSIELETKMRCRSAPQSASTSVAPSSLRTLAIPFVYSSSESVRPTSTEVPALRSRQKASRSLSRSGTYESGKQVVAKLEPASEDFFDAVVTDIKFRGRIHHESPSVTMRHSTVRKLLDCGPDAVMGSSRSQVRWIHLPANNMAWVEALMAKLHDEQTDHNNKVDEQNRETTRYDRVLHDDVWKLAFHDGAWNGSIHSRFMRPLTVSYSSADPDGRDESESMCTKPNVVVLYTPYLHWESYGQWKARQKHIAIMTKAQVQGVSCGCLDNNGGQTTADDKNKLLLHDYLFHDSSPLHDRRTLDRSDFYDFRDVAHRDEDQIVTLYTRNKLEQQDDSRKMIVIDQLWMWIVDDNTIITAFPQTGIGTDDEADVLHGLLKDLPRLLEQATVRSPSGLAGLIVDHCTGVFHRSDVRDDHTFFAFFADDIRTVTSKLTHMLDEFRQTSKSIDKLRTNLRTTGPQLKHLVDSMFSIKDEISQTERIGKIISDLDNIDYLCSQQGDVVRGLIKCLKHGRTHSRSILKLQQTIEKRRSDWASIIHKAKATHENLRSLLDLKQRQAAVVEACMVRYEFERSAKQWRPMMLLITFTVFLSSFFTSCFSVMHAKELNIDRQPLSITSGIMALASLASFAFALLFVFNPTRSKKRR